MKLPPRQQIRPVRVVPLEDQEDQLWPINLLVVILAAFVVGLILGLSRFDDPRLFYNAYFQLTTVGLTLLVWFVGIRWVRGRLKQRLKIAALFSLLVHLWLLLSLGVGYYRLLMESPSPDKQEEIAQLTVPEYPESLMERGELPSEYHRPVETPVPLVQIRAGKPLRANQLPKVERPSLQVPKRPEPDSPLPLPLERREVSPPHRAESPGQQIRRQISQVRQEPIPPLAVPEPQPVASPKGPLEPKAVLPREAPQTVGPSPAKPSLPEVPRPAPVSTPLARRQLAPRVPSTEASPPGPERQPKPAPEPLLQAQAPLPTPASPKPAFRYQPRPVALSRFEALPVERKPDLSAGKLPTSAPPSASLAKRDIQESSPQVVARPQSLPGRLPMGVVNVKEPEEPLPALAPAAEVRPQLRPLPTPVGRETPPGEQIAARPSWMITQTRSSPPPKQTAWQPAGREQRASWGKGQFQLEPSDPLPSRSGASMRVDGGVPEEVQPKAPAPGALEPSDQALTQAESVKLQRVEGSADVPGRQPARAWTGRLDPVTGLSGPGVAASARRPLAAQEGQESLQAVVRVQTDFPSRPPGTPVASATVPQEEASLGGATGTAQTSGGQQELWPWEAGSQTLLARHSPGAPVAQPAMGKVNVNFQPGGRNTGLVTSRGRASPAGSGTLLGGGPPELGRAPSGAQRLTGLVGTVAEAVPSWSAGHSIPPGTSDGGLIPSSEGVEPSPVPVAKTSTGLSLLGPPGAKEAFWQIPAKGGGVTIASTGGIGRRRELSPGGGGEGSKISGLSWQRGQLPRVHIAGKISGSIPSLGAKEGTQTGESGEEKALTFQPVLPVSQRNGHGLSEGIGAGRGPLGKTASFRSPGGLRGISPPGGGGIGVGIQKAGPNQLSQLGTGTGLSGIGLPRASRTGLVGLELTQIPSGGASGPQGAPSPASSTGGQPLRGDSGGKEATGLAGSSGAEGVKIQRQGGGLPVHISAPLGVGGMAQLPTPTTGVPTRPAHPQSPEVHLARGRFLLPRSATQLAIDAQAMPAEAFQQRHPTRRAQQVQKYGGTPVSEEAVERGLAFLAKLQWPDGRWRFHAIPESLEIWPAKAQQQPDHLLQLAQKILEENSKARVAKLAWLEEIRTLLERHSAGQLEEGDLSRLAQLVREAVFCPGGQQADSAATGLALLAFLGAGYTHQEGPYRLQIQRGLQWLLANQKPDGDLWGYSQGSPNTWLYSHGIAAIALCEAYGMSRDAALRPPAERAIEFIVAAQHPSRGGWRYRPREDSDTSVSGWMLMALKSAQMAGLAVPQRSLDLVARWLELAKAPNGDGSRYVYNPFSAQSDPKLWFHRQPTVSMTAEALLMRMYLGWNRDHPLLQRGADFLQANLPQLGTPDQPARDAYYWYYGTQVMFQMAGQHWETWNNTLRPYLESSQIKEGPLAGSWDPLRPVPDRFAHDGGRLYVTAMHLLILEVYYRHLPLFKTLRKDL